MLKNRQRCKWRTCGCSCEKLHPISVDNSSARGNAGTGGHQLEVPVITVSGIIPHSCELTTAISYFPEKLRIGRSGGLNPLSETLAITTPSRESGCEVGRKKRVNTYPKAFRLMALEQMKKCESVSAL